ncbi:DUF6470 family protein [Bacillus smithii]|uniref:DUF6470 family protein n=1 Tax=Bacillus smithii TaxID=1479 RepID=UPI002E1AE6C0|nr:DUF6470 family protein [Bacillus smithii]
MEFPQIRIQSQKAQIAIATTPPKQTIEQPPAQLDLKQAKAELHIERIRGGLTIDQTKAWESMDLKPISKRIEEAAEIGYQDWLEGIARRAEDGRELMEIEHKGNPLAEQAKRNSEPPEHQFNIGFIPPYFSVKLHYEPDRLKIDWDLHKAENHTKAQKPIIDYRPGNVSVQMAQYPALKIDFVHLKYKGIHYEQEI